MEHLGKHPFNYKIDEITSFISDLLDDNQIEEAVKTLKYIKMQYLTGRNSQEINPSRSPFYHLEDWHIQDMAHAFNGSRYPDGSKYRFIHELNKLHEQIRIKTDDAIYLDQKEEKGIKNEKYKDGASTKKLALYLYYINPRAYNHDFNKVAKEYGFKNGDKISNLFGIFDDSNRRIGPSKNLDTEKTVLNRKKDLKWVIERLPEESKRKAQDELDLLTNRFYNPD